MTHLKPDESQGGPRSIEEANDGGTSCALPQPDCRCCHISHLAARWRSRQAGKPIRTGGTAGLCQPVERGHLRLPSRLLLAGPCARPVEPLAQLDR